MLKKILAIALMASMSVCTLAGCSNNQADVREAVQSTDNYRNYYQIFVHSFSDSNDDGIGDIPGIINKLDYINDGDPNGGNDLGMDGLWLTPICQSESYHKYSVEDYCSIDNTFGTMEDFEKLSAECKERGINLITDLVVNHSSNKHPWFEKACEEVKNGKLDGYAQYYHIVKEENKVGSCTYYPIGDTEYYYEANFSDTMPELNLSNQR